MIDKETEIRCAMGVLKDAISHNDPEYNQRLRCLAEAYVKYSKEYIQYCKKLYEK